MGKTSICRRYTEGHFRESYLMTVGTSFAVKSVVIDDIAVKLQIWDLASDASHDSVRPVFYRGATIAILIYDLTRAATLLNIPQWINELEQVCGQIPMALVGNKLDLIPPEGQLIPPEVPKVSVETPTPPTSKHRPLVGKPLPLVDETGPLERRRLSRRKWLKEMARRWGSHRIRLGDEFERVTLEKSRDSNIIRIELESFITDLQKRFKFMCYFLTSAKTGEGVNTLFHTMAKVLLDTSEGD